jgi:hypothetical protein
LLTAWKIVCAAFAILRASPLGRRVLAAHVFESLKRGDDASVFKLIFEDQFQQHSAYLTVSETQ